MDNLAKLFAGHMGVATVLANTLTDKGVVGTEELSDRMREAHSVTVACDGAPANGRALAEMARYLDAHADKRPVHS